MSRGRGRALAEDIELAEGRPEPVMPFSMLGDWVMLALGPQGLRHPALSLYWALCAHLNRNRGDRKVWPTQDTLAEMLGYSEGNKIAPYLRELVAIGALEIIKKPVRGGGGRVRCLYVIHKTPPPDYDGFECLDDFYADRAARQAADRAAAMTAEQEPPEKPEPAASSPKSPGAQMSTRPGCPNEHPAECSDEHLNQKKKPEEENKNGGACRRPPEPPADPPAGRVGRLVALGGDQQRNQQIVRARFAAERAAVLGCSLCDEAGLARGGVECSHPPEYAIPETPPASTLAGERAPAG